MKLIYGTCKKPFLICHGGAGPMDPSHTWVTKATDSILNFLEKKSRSYLLGSSPLETILFCLKNMEENENFNAGYGSALQNDGKARLTAALMEGTTQNFSGVISATNVLHPSIMAMHLQNQTSKVLTNPGTDLLARSLNLPDHNCISKKRLDQWVHKIKLEECWDTVGCVVSQGENQLACGTSTGGKGYETPGRVSDSGTVAGNYSSSFCSISATGIGEEIVDDGLAVRIETRVRDGMPLKLAAERTFEEANKKSRSYGWIAIDKEGNYSIAFTTKAMTYVAIDIEDSILERS